MITDTELQSRRRAPECAVIGDERAGTGTLECIVLEPSPAERAAAVAYSALCEQIVRVFNHDLRTPLTTLLCHAELLLETEGLPVAAERSLAAMSRAGQVIRHRLADLCLDLDAPRRESTGRVPTHMASLMRGVVRRHDAVPSGADVRLETSVPEDLVFVVDATLIRRAIMELLHNAVSHAPQGSTVRLSVQVDADEVCIDVRDEGAGPCAQDRKRLVAALAGSDARSRPPGAELGLAIARSVAATHGGRVVLTDLPGGGFCASVRLDAHIVSTA